MQSAFFSPKYSPTLIIGRWIVNKLVPEYVGAAQKKFAWVIGLVLAVGMFGLIVMLIESAFGICLGCLFHKWFYKEKAHYCPGEICQVKDRHDIRKTSFTQLIIVLAFIGSILASLFLNNDTFSQMPGEFWEILSKTI